MPLINFRASKRAQERLELLLDLTHRVVSNLSLRDVPREISANIRRVMQCDGVGIDLPTPDDYKLRLYALDFPNNPGVIEERQEPPASEKHIVTQVFRTGQALILFEQDLAAEPSFATLGVRSCLCVPLTGRNGTVGVLGLGSLQENAITVDDRSFLTQIAGQVATAIENAWAFREVSVLKEKLALEKRGNLGPHRFHRADLWRNGDRQRTDRTRRA
jgi:formate hydrogenlyase transcriptional activator